MFSTLEERTEYHISFYRKFYFTLKSEEITNKNLHNLFSSIRSTAINNPLEYKLHNVLKLTIWNTLQKRLKNYYKLSIWSATTILSLSGNGYSNHLRILCIGI
jgi:hypothetical protein